MDVYRQAKTLANKTLKIIITRHFTATLYSALVLPVLSAVYLGIGQNLTNPNSKFGIGDPHDVRSLGDALGKAGGGRDTVVFVNGGHTSGAIDGVIDSLSDIVSGAGKNATTLTDEDDIGYVCKSSYRGTSNCFGAVVFYSSPDEGDDGIWNYTLRADAALGQKVKVNKNDNDAQIYTLPLQRAVDSAITKSGSFEGEPLPDTTQAYAYTQMTEDERQAQLRRDYQSSFINYLSVAFLISLIGVCYHMPGLIATEREKGLSSLIDAMMPARGALDRQIARMASHHLAFTATYFPGWLVASIICRAMIWQETSYGVIIPFFILGGMAITSMSLLSASFFKKAQLSGVVTSVIWIALGIVAQALGNPGTGPIAVLSILFTPCNFVFFIIAIARFEAEGMATNLTKPPPKTPSDLPVIIHWVFFIVQIIVYPLLAASVERWLHGVSANSHKPQAHQSSDQGPIDTVRVENATKIFRPSLLRRLFSFVSSPRPEVKAVDNLTLTAKKGQILALLGANGSGKSTTLDAIAGISSFTHGSVSVDTTGGLGVAPQKNVLWDELTVEEHIQIFNQLKSPRKPATEEENEALIEAIGLGPKLMSQSRTLSGGQKRKLQLGMMLTAGSAVCCVDEVSSGIDPLSRRKIWDILLEERGNRTIIMTTHFLDEADLLADNITILSKGRLQAEGSSAELKDNLGAGYRVHVLDAKHVRKAPEIDGVDRRVTSNSIMYVAPTSHLAAEVIKVLEHTGIKYQFSGPTIEDVFLHVENSARTEQDGLLPAVGKEASPDSEKARVEGSTGADDLGLLNAKPTSFVTQTWVLVRKRITVFKTNWIPYLAAFVIPIIAAAITQLLIKNTSAVGCKPIDRAEQTTNEDFNNIFNAAYVVAGPSSTFENADLSSLFGPYVSSSSPISGGDQNTANLTLEDDLSALKSFIKENRKEVLPGGWWLGDSGSEPLVGYAADNMSMYTSVITQNFLDTMLTQTPISASYKHFDSPFLPSNGKGLQLAVYLGLAASIFPGLFGLYVSQERRLNVRSLQYSSGARAMSLWASHVSFDFFIILISMAIVTIVYAVSSDIWYHVAYLFPVLILYGLVALLVTYLMSLAVGSSLATFAATTAFLGVGFAVYFIAFLYILTFSDATAIDKNILIGHWVIAAFTPMGSLIRSLLVALNAYSSACDGDALQSYPAAMTAYGGPILYLVVQAVLCFAALLWFDSGLSNYRSGVAQKTPDSNDPELAEELVRVTGPDNQNGGLRTLHLAKAYGKFTAVDNVSFGVDRGEVFALLGPNGAGKSTTISLIRGDIAPSRNGGDVFIENFSIVKNRAQARTHLGVCPQFDAIDHMTVREHLQFYARLRGINDVNHQVASVIRAVGLDAYANVMAHTLSGGNKRKLSLGIALTGNPSVILLDEPSSGLDAAAKRIMWKTLETIVPGRAILLTTHSMEEADTLASRAGILAKRMLALGTTQHLRDRYGDTLHVHLVSKTAPHSTDEEMQRMRSWVVETFPTAEVEQDTYHGQMRFSVPSSDVLDKTRDSQSSSAIGQLLITLEEHKDQIGVAHHSVSPTTLNQVFLTIVGEHDVQEEGYVEQSKPWWRMNPADLFQGSKQKKRQQRRNQNRPAQASNGTQGGAQKGQSSVQQRQDGLVGDVSNGAAPQISNGSATAYQQAPSAAPPQDQQQHQMAQPQGAPQNETGLWKKELKSLLFMK